MTRRSVDFPLPLGPSKAVSEPLSTSIDTSSSATNSPKRFVTLRASIAMGLLSGSEHRHCDEREDRESGKEYRPRIGAGVGAAVLVGRLHVQRQRLRPARDVSRNDRDGAELTKRTCGREYDTVGNGPANRGQGDAPERREGG